MVTIQEMREEREAINQQMEALRMKAVDLSERIRQAEGPIPDRSHRAGNGRLGYTIAPTKQDEA